MRTKKALKAVALLMVAVCMLLFVPGSMTAKADDIITTYTVQYDEGLGQWRMQPQYPWNYSTTSRELYYLKDMEDGDKLVVLGSAHPLELKLNVKLSNVTLSNTNTAVIYAKSIDEVIGVIQSRMTILVNEDR